MHPFKLGIDAAAFVVKGALDEQHRVNIVLPPILRHKVFEIIHG